MSVLGIPDGWQFLWITWQKEARPKQPQCKADKHEYQQLLLFLAVLLCSESFSLHAFSSLLAVTVYQPLRINKTPTKPVSPKASAHSQGTSPTWRKGSERNCYPSQF